MKTTIKVLLCALLLVGCRKKETIVLFGSVMNQEAKARVYVHDSNWLTVSGLKQIYTIRIPVEESAKDIRKTLGDLLPDGYKVNQVVTAFVYSIDTDTSKVDISLDDVHAMSLVRQQGKDLYHDYLEKQAGHFVLLPELTARVNGGFDMDDLRLLHFAAAPTKGLPKVSSIFELRMNPLQSFSSEGEPNKSIGDAVLVNMKLNKGMNTLDIYGEHFYKVMLKDQPGGGHQYCGGSERCDLGSEADHCVPPPAGPDTKGTCQKGGGCFNAVLTYAFTSFKTEMPPFDLVELYKFKDSFLMNYPKGREFVAYMYLIGRYMRMDEAALGNYLKLTIASEEAVRKIQSKEDNVIVFGKEYVDLISRFIQNHKGSGSKELEQALAILEADLRRVNGYTRGQVLQFLNEGVTGGGRG